MRRTQRAALQRVDTMPDKVALQAWVDDEWRKRWNTAAKEQRATVWKTEWGDSAPLL